MTTNTPRTNVRAMLDAAIGARIPGGCERCEAYQTMTRDDLGIHHLTVHHDDDCPVLRAMTGGAV